MELDFEEAHLFDRGQDRCRLPAECGVHREQEAALDYPQRPRRSRAGEAGWLARDGAVERRAGDVVELHRAAPVEPVQGTDGAYRQYERPRSSRQIQRCDMDDGKVAVETGDVGFHESFQLFALWYCREIWLLLGSAADVSA